MRRADTRRDFEIMEAKHPKDFQIGEIVQSIYSGVRYEIIVADKKGMAKLKNLETGKIQDFNAYNNEHFILTSV